MPEAEGLALKVGVDIGTTLTTRLGKHGDRDNICLGVPARRAADLEEIATDSEIAISQAVYDLLDGKDLRTHFAEAKERGCWVAEGLTFERLAAQEASQMHGSGKPLLVAAAAVAVGAIAGTAFAIAAASTEEEKQRAIQPSRTYASER